MIRRTLLILIIATALHAVDKCPTPELNGEIRSHSEFSYIETKGNTNTSSLAFSGAAKTRFDDHIFRIHTDATRASNNGRVNRNRFLAELNYNYQFDDIYSFNHLIGYKEDRFSGFDYQTYAGPGMGIKIFKTPEYQLDLQTNLLWSKDKPNGVPLTNYFSTKTGIIYEWNILKNLKFIEEVSYRLNLEQTKYYFFYSKTAIENKITSTLAMGTSYKIDYVNTPPSLSQHTDRVFLVSLIMDY